MIQARIRKLRAILKEKNCDSMLVSNVYNIFYLTQFETLSPEEREAFVFLTEKDCYLFTDGRYIEKNHTQTKDGVDIQYRLISHEQRMTKQLEDIVTKERLKSIAFEGHDLSFTEHAQLKEKIPTVTWIDIQDAILKIRATKEEDEIDNIRKACKLTDESFEQFIKYIKPGITEKELAWTLEKIIREKGCDLGFDPIVAIGPNSAVAHYNTKKGGGFVEDQSIILVDFGMKFNHYISDITRMVFVGKPSDSVVRTYETLLDAQLKAVSTRAHKTSEIDKTARDIITSNKLPNFSHSVGHGVGLEIHELPRITLHVDDEVKANQVFTIEPGVYVPGEYGMRIEDTVVVKEDFSLETLTRFSKDLLVL